MADPTSVGHVLYCKPNKTTALMAPVIFKAGLLFEPVPIRCAGYVSLVHLLIKAKPTFNAVTPRAVSDETSERGGVSPPVLGRKPAWEEPGGLPAC